MKPVKMTIILIVILILIIMFIVNFILRKNDSSLISAGVLETTSQQPSPLPDPVTPFNSYNPPKEFKYDKDTNLKQELDSVNPQIMDADFLDVNSLAK